MLQQQCVRAAGQPGCFVDRGHFTGVLKTRPPAEGFQGLPLILQL